MEVVIWEDGWWCGFSMQYLSAQCLRALISNYSWWCRILADLWCPRIPDDVAALLVTMMLILHPIAISDAGDSLMCCCRCQEPADSICSTVLCTDLHPILVVPRSWHTYCVAEFLLCYPRRHTRYRWRFSEPDSVRGWEQSGMNSLGLLPRPWGRYEW